MKRVLAIASGGGHWEQLMLLTPAYVGADVHYATTLAGLPQQSGLEPATIIPDCNRDQKAQIARCALHICVLVLRLRPHVIITTGALPGLLSLMIGRKMGARTIWIDSIANAEEMSMAGKAARHHADHWLTQWPDVAAETGATYLGSVL